MTCFQRLIYVVVGSFLGMLCGLGNLNAEDTQNMLILGGSQPSELRQVSPPSPSQSQNTQNTKSSQNITSGQNTSDAEISTSGIQRIPAVRLIPAARVPQEVSSATSRRAAEVPASTNPPTHANDVFPNITSIDTTPVSAVSTEPAPSLSAASAMTSQFAAPLNVAESHPGENDSRVTPKGGVEQTTELSEQSGASKQNSQNEEASQNVTQALPQTIFETIQSQPVQTMRSWLIEHLGESAWKGIERILSALLVFGVFWLIANWLRKLLELYGAHQDINPDIVETLAKIAKIGLWTVGGTTALGQFGIDVTPLITSLGITSLAVGLAMKEVCSNAVAGMQILIYKPFRRHDHIQVQSFKGRVLEVNLRYTVLEQEQTTERVLLPNTLLLSNTLLVTAMEHRPCRRAPDVNPLQQVSDGIRRMLHHHYDTTRTAPNVSSSETSKSPNGTNLPNLSNVSVAQPRSEASTSQPLSSWMGRSETDRAIEAEANAKKKASDTMGSEDKKEGMPSERSDGSTRSFSE
ncbi:MAG: mechanosensitive ion channel [Thermoguttaceae bacterium]|nr:mechanosensitive ion channel [Thermoguttaceae bacterium]